MASPAARSGPTLAFAIAVAASASASPALEFKVCALVKAQAVSWPEIPADAIIDTARLSFRRLAFLESRDAIEAKAPEVRRALAAALKPLRRAERRRTAKVLEAIGSWFSASVSLDSSPVGCPDSWRTAAEVIREGRGNPFERVRALAALARAAGIPARPSFNGVPVLCVYAYGAAPAKPGFWTVWDPVHPSGSFRKLPVLWLPLGAGEVLPVSAKPKVECHPSIEGRRYGGEGAAYRAFDFLKRNGGFPGPGDAIGAEAEEWWEVWSIGALVDDAAGEFTATVPLPFVKDIAYGTREHGVWVSEPGRLKSVSPPHAQTDQELGGLVLTVLLQIGPHVSAAAGGG